MQVSLPAGTVCNPGLVWCYINPFSDDVAPSECVNHPDHWQTSAYIAANWLRNVMLLLHVGVLAFILCVAQIVRLSQNSGHSFQTLFPLFKKGNESLASKTRSYPQMHATCVPKCVRTHMQSGGWKIMTARLTMKGNENWHPTNTIIDIMVGKAST